MSNIKILVACHKPDVCRHDVVFTPIHVGREISKITDKMSNFIGDNTGDNISSLNPYYCELTAQYWMWKNLKNVDIVGLAHYRRYFKGADTEDNIKRLLGNADVIMANRLYERFSMADKIALAATSEDLYIFVDCLKKVSPDYFDAACNILEGNYHSPYNMFIMRKADFDKFAEWQFSILREVYGKIRFSSYCRMKRVLGYMAELLLSIYVLKNNMKAKYLSVVDYDGNLILPFKYNIFRKLYINLGFRLFNHRKLKFDDSAVKVGLKNDNIDINL